MINNIFMDQLIRNAEEKNEIFIWPNLCRGSNSNVTTEEMLQEWAKLRVNILEGGTKVNDSLQQFVVSKKENEHKMEANWKKLMSWKTVQKSLDPIKQCIKGTHREEKAREESLN